MPLGTTMEYDLASFTTDYQAGLCTSLHLAVMFLKISCATSIVSLQWPHSTAWQVSKSHSLAAKLQSERGKGPSTPYLPRNSHNTDTPSL